MRPLPTPKNKTLILYLLLLVCAVALMTCLRQCGNGKESSPLSESVPGGSGGDTLDVALVYGPMSYYVYSDTLGGYNYDIMRLISRNEGLPMKFWPVNSLSEALELLQKGRYDMLATLPEDAEYREKLLFSEPLFLDRQVLVQRKGDNIVNSVLDLAGDTVHIEKDSPVADRLKNLCREIGDTIYVVKHPEYSGELLSLQVQSGELRYVVVNEQLVRPLADKFDNLDFSGQISFTQFQCIVVADKDSALLKRVNSWLKKIDNTPEAKAIHNKYFH